MRKNTRIAYRRATRFLPLVAALAAMTACSHNGERPTFSRRAGQGNQVTIVADNQNFLDATVYALWGAQRDRVGMVTGKTSQSFSVPFRGSDLQLQIDLIGGSSMTTDHIGVFEGDQLDLVIPPTQN